MVSEIKFFYLTDGLMGLNCLRDLIKKNFIPELIITHKNFQLDNNTITIHKQLGELSKQENISLSIVENLKEIKSDLKNFHLGICVGFMEILKKEYFNLPLLGIYNLHCGKLPEYRGRAPISRAVINGEKEIVMTVHRIETGVDSGAILIEKKISITEEDTAYTLYNKCSENSGDLIAKVFEIIERNNLINNPVVLSKLLNPQPEPTKPPNKSISEEERIIHWEKSAREIYNLIRGLVPPYPSAITFLKFEKLLITKAIIKENQTDNIFPGYIQNVTDKSILVLCKKGSIELTEIIYRGKSIENFSEIFKTGDILK